MTSIAENARHVSVVLAVRDGERYLGEALDSVLGQEPSPGEVIVVDDGSTDATATILARYADSVRTLRQPPSGPFVAVNRGVQAAVGDTLGFLDADDVWTPNALAARLERLAAPDRPEAVFGRTVQFVSPELDEAVASRFRFDREPAAARLFQSMLIRRAAFDRIGPLATSYATSANIEWISRAQTLGLRAVDIDDVVARRRLHGAHMSLSRTKHADLLSIVREHRQRRHSAPPPSPQ